METHERVAKRTDDALDDTPFSTVAADWCSVVKAFIGSNYLGIPYAFHLCGVALAVPLFWAIAFFSRQGCRLLLECQLELDRRDAASCGGHASNAQSLTVSHTTVVAPASSSPPRRRTSGATSSLSIQESGLSLLTPTSVLVAAPAPSRSDDHGGGAYATIGQRLFDARMAHVVRACLVLTQFGFCCGYLVFLSNTLTDLAWLPNSLPHALVVALFAVPLALLALLRDLSALAPFNAFANVALLCGCIAVVYCELDHISSTGSTATIKWVDVGGVPVFFGLMVGALEGIGLVMPLHESISAPGRSGAHRFGRFLDMAIAGVAGVLTAVGLLGYITYGDTVPDIIIAALPKNAASLAVLRVCLIGGIFFTFPMQIFPVTEVLDVYILGASAASFASTPTSDDNAYAALHDETRPFPFVRCALIRVLTVCGVAGIAIAVPQFHIISSFTGCIGGSMLSFILPAVFHQRCFAPARASCAGVQNVALVAVGVAGSVAGLYFNIKDLL